MNAETKRKSKVEEVRELNQEAKAQLLCEVAEKAEGKERQEMAQTAHVAEQLKEEIYQHIDEPSY